MRHLKRWELFESNRYESFIRDIEDSSLELSDLGMEVKVWSEIDTKTYTPVPNSYKEAIQVNIKKFTDGLLDIKEFIERSSDILEDFNVKCFGLSSFKVYKFGYNDIKDDNTVITNLSEYHDVDFHEIYIRFYKPENVYHVVRYNKKISGWSLVEANINNKEEAIKISNEYKIKNFDIMGDISLVIISDREYWDSIGDVRYFREKYKLHESVDNAIIIYDDIKEIFAELVDDGYKIITKMGSSQLLNIINKHYVSISGPIESPFEPKDYMRFHNIKDELLRLKDYLGTRWIKAGVVYEGDHERVEVNITEEDYDNLDDTFIINLVIFFNI